MIDELWKYVATVLVSILVGATPGYFLLGPSKPTRKEVKRMISERTPPVVQKIIRNIMSENVKIGNRVTILEERLSYLIQQVKELKSS